MSAMPVSGAADMPAPAASGPGCCGDSKSTASEPLGADAIAAIDAVLDAHLGPGSPVAECLERLLEQEQEANLVLLELEQAGAEDAALVLALLERIGSVQQDRELQVRIQSELERVAESVKAGEAPPLDSVVFLDEQGMSQTVDDVVAAAAAESGGSSDQQQGGETPAAPAEELAVAGLPA